MFENQRSAVVSGWKQPFLPSDRGAWTDRSGATTKSVIGPWGHGHCFANACNVDVAMMQYDRGIQPREAPKGWMWVSPEWSVDMHAGGDDQGWDYARDFPHFGTSPRGWFFGACVRRRRWVRSRIRDPHYHTGADFERLCCCSPNDGVLVARQGDGKWSKPVKVGTAGTAGYVLVLGWHSFVRWVVHAATAQKARSGTRSAGQYCSHQAGRVVCIRCHLCCAVPPHYPRGVLAHVHNCKPHPDETLRAPGKAAVCHPRDCVFSALTTVVSGW